MYTRSYHTHNHNNLLGEIEIPSIFCCKHRVERLAKMYNVWKAVYTNWFGYNGFDDGDEE